MDRAALAVSRTPLNFRQSSRCVGSRAQRMRVASVRPHTVAASSSEPTPLRAAAIKAVDTFVKDGNVVGLGTGEMSSHIFEYIKECLEVKAFKDIVCLPTTSAAATESAFHGISQDHIGSKKQVDVLFQEADVIDVTSNAFVMGRRTEPQQPQLMNARLAMNKAKKCVVLVDSEEKIEERLGGYLPVVIDYDNWEDAAEEVDSIFLGDAEIWRRPAEGTANPRGGDNPYISPEGHNIIDIRFYGTMKFISEECEYQKIATEIMSVDGVITHGLFLDKGTDAVIVTENGAKILELEKASQEA